MSRFVGNIFVERTGPRALVEWDAPPLNIFSGRLLRQLARMCRTPEVQTASVVVLRGRGRCWSAGLDVGEHLRPALPAMLESFSAALRAVWEIPAPTIAQVHGACLGGGLELMGVCDLAYAGTSASFGQPEIRLGVFPPFGAAHLPTALGPRRAAEILFLGETLAPADALQAGLVNRIVADADLPATVERAASLLEAHRPAALVHLKRALRRGTAPLWKSLSAAERIYLDDLMAGPDAEEGLHAFLEKRRPEWPTTPPPRAAPE